MARRDAAMTEPTTERPVEPGHDGRPAWVGVITFAWVCGILYHFFTTLGFIELATQLLGGAG